MDKLSAQQIALLRMHADAPQPFVAARNVMTRCLLERGLISFAQGPKKLTRLTSEGRYALTIIADCRAIEARAGRARLVNA